jgi:hypothetical protein
MFSTEQVESAEKVLRDFLLFGFSIVAVDPLCGRGLEGCHSEDEVNQPGLIVEWERILLNPDDANEQLNPAAIAFVIEFYAHVEEQNRR